MDKIIAGIFFSIFASLPASAQNSSQGGFDLMSLVPLLIVIIIIFVTTSISKKKKAASEAALEKRFNDIENRLNSLENSK